MKIDDFEFRFANVNGTGSTSAITLSADPGKLAAWTSASRVEKALKKKETPTPLTMSQSIIRKPTRLPDLPSGVNDFVRKLFSVCNESVARQVSIFPFTHEEALDQLLISEFAKMQGPIELDSKWVIQIDAHYIGGGRHFRTWEVADIGLMVVFRNNGVIIRSKLVFLQSKKLFASAVKYRPIDPYFRQGMGRLLQTDAEHADLIKKRNLKFSSKSKYQALKAKADQADAMHSFAQRYGVELFYLLYNHTYCPGR